MLSDQARPFRDFKSAAAGDRADDFDFPAAEQRSELEDAPPPNVYGEIDPGPQRDRRVAVRAPRLAQIAERKKLKLAPSEREWPSVLAQILGLPAAAHPKGGSR